MNLNIHTIDELEGIGPGPAHEPKWKTVAWEKGPLSKKKARNVAKIGSALFKIENKQDGDWWSVDDMARAASGDGFAHWSTGGWTETTQEGLERIKLLFRILGVDDKLTICENPEWAPELKPRDLEASLTKEKLSSLPKLNP
jgi:hypothetical protein